MSHLIEHLRVVGVFVHMEQHTMHLVVEISDRILLLQVLCVMLLKDGILLAVDFFHRCLILRNLPTGLLVQLCLLGSEADFLLLGFHCEIFAGLG